MKTWRKEINPDDIFGISQRIANTNLPKHFILWIWQNTHGLLLGQLRRNVKNLITRLQNTGSDIFTREFYAQMYKPH